LCEDGSISVYDRKKKMVIGCLSEGSGSVNGIKWFSSKLANSFITCGKSLLMYSYSNNSWSLISLLKLKSLGRVELTAIGIHPNKPYVLCGTSQGSIWYIDAAKRSIISSHNISALQVTDISFDSTGNYIAIAYFNGLVNLYNSQLDFILQLERPFGVSLSEDKVNNAKVTLFNSSLNESKDQFYSISLHSSNTIRMHRILTNRIKPTKEVITDISATEGNITSFILHPSKKYIILTNDKDSLYVYHIPTSKLRKKIRTLSIPKECKLDPSGLYAAIILEDTLIAGKKIRVIDIETESAIAEINDIGDIISFEFASDGKYFTVVTAGATMIYEVFGTMRKKIVRVLDTNYWDNNLLQQNDNEPIAKSQVFARTSLTSPREFANTNSAKFSLLAPLTSHKTYLPVTQSLEQFNRSPEAKKKVFKIRKISNHSPIKSQREGAFFGTTRSLYKERYENIQRQEELPKVLHTVVHVSQEDWKQIRPDPEDIDVSEESAITKELERSECDSVDRMYEEIQAFTNTFNKANPINI
jgi:hypothetical protein